MSKENAITDRRLLAALDYIDQKYIDDVFDIIKEPEAVGEPEKMTWRTPLKHWRQFAALAACILLLSIASPLVSYIAEVISNFNAGAGSSSENSSELLTEPETTNGMYDEYILTEEDIAEINEAYFKRTVLDNPNYANVDESFIQELKDRVFLIASVKEAMQGLSNYYYLGKYGDSFVIITQPTEMGSAQIRTYNVGKYEFTILCHGTMLVCYDSQFYTPQKAYEMGLFTEYDVEMMYQVYSNGYFDWLP